MSQTYDYVVLATPPVDAAPAARALAPGADFVVLAGLGDATDAAARDALVRSGAGKIFVVSAEAEPTIERENTKTAA